MNCWIQFLKRGCQLQSRTSLSHTYIFCLVGNFRLMKRCRSYLLLQSRNGNYPSLYSLFVDLFLFFCGNISPSFVFKLAFNVSLFQWNQRIRGDVRCVYLFNILHFHSRPPFPSHSFTVPILDYFHHRIDEETNQNQGKYIVIRISLKQAQDKFYN